MFSKHKGVLILLIALQLSVSPQISASPSPKITHDIKPFQKLYGGTLVFGNNNSPTIINPILTDSSISVSVMNLVFNRLVQYDSSGQIQSNLAESWEISPDGLIYTFRIRHGVKFHDGIELTAEDVLYTYAQIMNPKNHSPFLRNFNLVKKMEIVDSHTFRVFIKKPSVAFIYAMMREIVPKHLYEKENLRTGSFNRHPIGTGPFRFKEWRKNNQIILEANPDYFEGRPFLDSIVYKVYPTGEEVWSALMRGEVDLAEFLSIENYELTRKDPSFETYATATAHYYLISYNLNDPLMSDRRIRLAIAHAVDRKGLIRDLEKGYGIEATGPFNRQSWAFNPDVKALSYDPSAAVALLKKAGWQDLDHDGILKNDNSKLIVRILVNAKDEKLKRMIMFIRQNLQEVGMELQVQLYDNVEEMRRFISSGKFQAVLTFFPGSGVVDPNETIKFWDSLDRRSWGARVHWMFNEKVDRLIHLAAVTQDKKVRQEIYYNVHRLIYEQQTACFLYSQFDFHAVSKRIGGTESFLGSPYMPDNLIKDFYVKNSDFKVEGGDA